MGSVPLPGGRIPGRARVLEMLEPFSGNWNMERLASAPVASVSLKGPARSPVTLSTTAARTFDVARFYGDPARASELLGWRATITVEQGMRRLVAEFADAAREMSEEARLA